VPRNWECSPRVSCARFAKLLTPYGQDTHVWHRECLSRQDLSRLTLEEEEVGVKLVGLSAAYGRALPVTANRAARKNNNDLREPDIVSLKTRVTGP